MSRQVGVGRSTLSLVKKVNHPGSYEQSLEIHLGPHRSMRRLIIGLMSQAEEVKIEVFNFAGPQLAIVPKEFIDEC
jgi:hypothetical protein